jgi:hypothetical protein
VCNQCHVDVQHEGNRVLRGAGQPSEGVVMKIERRRERRRKEEGGGRRRGSRM